MGGPAFAEKIYASFVADRLSYVRHYRVTGFVMVQFSATVYSPRLVLWMGKRKNTASPPHKDEWLAGLCVFLLVVGATLPVVLPFLFIHQNLE